MNVVVTGGSGFIGSHVVDSLVGAGHSVTVIDHRVRPHRADVAFEDVDLLDLSSVIAATRDAEHVFHLAAVSNVNYAFKYPVYSTALNVMGTTNVLEAARINEAKRVHLASTVWVYNGSPDSDVSDETVPFYLNGAGHIYTSTKMACEMICHNYGELYGLPFTVLRYGIPYGPRMREELLIPIFLKKALNGEPLTISGDGSQYRKFVYVEDIAREKLLLMGMDKRDIDSLEENGEVSQFILLRAPSAGVVLTKNVVEGDWVKLGYGPFVSSNLTIEIQYISPLIVGIKYIEFEFLGKGMHSLLFWPYPLGT